MNKSFKTYILSKKNNKLHFDLDQNEINPLYFGFQYGKGVFTTAKYRKSMIEFYFDHILRLQNSCKYYDIYFDSKYASIIMDEVQKLVLQIQNSDDEMKISFGDDKTKQDNGVAQRNNKDYEVNKKNIKNVKKIKNLDSNNDRDEFRIKIIVSYISSTESYVTLIVEPYSKKQHSVNLIINPAKRGDEEIYRHKTCNYLTIAHDMEMLSKINERTKEKKSKLWTNTKYDQWLYVDSENKIVEASYSNIFFIRDNGIVTPDKSLPLLQGIIRNKIVSLQSFSIVSDLAISSLSASKSASNKPYEDRDNETECEEKSIFSESNTFYDKNHTIENHERLNKENKINKINKLCINKLKIKEVIIDDIEIKTYDAAFITNSLIGCVPVSLIEKEGEQIFYNLEKAFVIIEGLKKSLNIY